MKFKLLLFCLFMGTYVAAQIADKKGCVVLINGSVCRGVISYYAIQQNNFHVEDSNGVVNIFETIQVKTVLLDNGEKFVSYPLISETITSNLILQSLIESDKISLFKQLKSGSPAFYVLKESVLYQLQNDKIIVSLDSTKNNRFDNKNIRTLSHLLSDKPGFDTKANNIHLNESELTRIVTLYINGNSSYSWKSKNKQYWSVFGQFSGYRSGNFNVTPDGAMSATAGIQYNFTKWTRSAIKLSFDYRDFHHTSNDLTSYNLSIRYVYALLNKEHYSFYLMANLTDLSYFLYTDPEHDHINHKQIVIRADVHPGIGLEISPKQRFSLFVEYNGLSNLEKYFFNFSLGLRYKYRKK